MITGPAELDLEPIREAWRYRGTAPHHTIMALIAEIEALRARVADLERIEAAITAANDGAMKGYSEALDRAEVAEARVAELEGVLDRIVIASEFHAQAGVADHVMRYAHEATSRLASATLAALPAKGKPSAR